MDNAKRSTPNKEKPPYDLKERLLDFGDRCIRLVDQLENRRGSSHVANQLVRSSSSPLGNHAEGEAAESRNDFNHKFSICLKELRESRRWLRLIQRVPLIHKPELVEPLIEESDVKN